MVVRRIRILLEEWDRSSLDEQQRTIGRLKYSGAPLGSQHEFDAVDLDALDDAGQPVIPIGAHIREAAPATNGGVHLLRRGYSFDDGVDHARRTGRGAVLRLLPARPAPVSSSPSSTGWPARTASTSTSATRAAPCSRAPVACPPEAGSARTCSIGDGRPQGW